MKSLIYLLIPAVLFTACGEKKADSAAELAQLKKDRSELDQKIIKLEGNKKDSVKVTPVSVTIVQPTDFHGYIEVQSQIGGDEVVTATAKAPGTINKIIVILRSLNNRYRHSALIIS